MADMELLERETDNMTVQAAEKPRVLVGKRRAISNIFRYFTTVIDLSSRRYWCQERFFGIRFGNYKPLPKIDYVLVFRSLFAKCEACSFEDGDDNPSAYYQVSLVHHRNRRIVVHETRDRQDAFAMARSLASDLQLRVMDSATNPAKGAWVKQIE